MRAKTVAIILAVISIVLAAGLFFRHSQAVKEKRSDTAAIHQLSNVWVQVKTSLDEQKLVNLSLERDLDGQSQLARTYSNNLSKLNADFSKLQSKAKEEAELAQAELTKRDAKIQEYEAQRDEMTKRMDEMKGSIDGLENQIADTQRRLEAAEGDREFLLKELKRLQAEKAELERQFNNLALLRDQVRRLRDELSVARRLDWIRRGIYGNQTMKGAERLQRGLANTTSTNGGNYNLDVEIKRDGGVELKSPPVTNNPTPPPATDGGTTSLR